MVRRSAAIRCAVIHYCTILVTMVTTAPAGAHTDSCTEISKVLTDKFQKHLIPEDVQNLYTCNRGLTCCNSISEYFFKKSVSETFTGFALFTVTRLMENLKEGVYAQQINWEVFGTLIQKAETGSKVSYEHFFELAVMEIMKISDSCLSRKDTKALKSEAMDDIVSLVNDIYVYKQGVEAINATLQATASLKPSKECASNVSKAGIPLDLKYQSSGCPLCLDSTSGVKVCRDLCLNIVRGCYASILLYKETFLQLVQKMDTAYFNLNYNLEMENGSLHSFIDKIMQLPRSEDSAECPTDSSRPPPVQRGRRRRQNRRTDLSQWRDFFSKQLALNTAIVDPATLPCAHANNSSPCWNGKSAGSYDHLSYSYTKMEQEINPEGADMDLTPEQVSAVELMLKSLDLLNRTSHGEHLLPLYKEVDITTSPSIPASFPPTREQNFEPLPVTRPGYLSGNTTDSSNPDLSTTERRPPRVHTKKPYTVGRRSHPYNYLELLTSEPTHDRFNNNSVEGESEASISGVAGVTTHNMVLVWVVAVYNCR